MEYFYRLELFEKKKKTILQFFYLPRTEKEEKEMTTLENFWKAAFHYKDDTFPNELSLLLTPGSHELQTQAQQ